MPLPLRSLKLRLLLPYAALIVLLTSFIGGMTYLAGTRTVTDLSDHLLQEMAARLRQSIQHHVGGSAAVLEAVFPYGMAAEPDIRTNWLALRNRLWAATTLHPRSNDYVHYGNVSGQNVGLKRLPEGSAELRIRTDAQQHRSFYRLDSIDGQQQFVRTERSLFDPRTRPWFQQAARAEQHTWTSVYLDFSLQDLVLTRARRVLNAQGAFEGVVATDVSLRALNDVVNELGRSVHGLAFVIEPSGDLVAVSGMPNTRFADAGRIERTSIHSPDNHLVKSIYLQIRRHFDGPLPHANEIDSLSSVRSLRIQDQEVGPIHVAFVRITDQAGLDWMAAVAVPRATILSNVSRMVEWVVIAGALCLLLTLVIGMRLFGSIADEVRSLSEAVKRAGHSGPHAPSPQLAPHRTDEVSELARNFSRMRHKLFTDHLTGISNRNALQHALANLMSAPQMAPSSTPFALLFIDLDLFKQLNDRWGHDNGDLALAEVAQRLRNHLRAEDHVARLGGDEFVVVLRGVEQRAAAQAASAKLAELICAPLATLQDIPAGVEVRLGASIGVALYPHDAHDVQGLLRHADQQMYAQKSQRPA